MIPVVNKPQKTKAEKVLPIKKFENKANNKVTGKEKSKLVRGALGTNEIPIKINLQELNKLILKYGGHLKYDDYDMKNLPLVVCAKNDAEYKKACSGFGRNSHLFVIYEEKNLLCVNQITSGSQQLSITEKFLAELSKKSLGDFKLAVLDEEQHCPIYFIRIKNNINYELFEEDYWEDSEVFQELIRSKGLEENEDGDYDADELYEIKYEVYDILLNNPEYLAPDWFNK